MIGRPVTAAVLCILGLGALPLQAQSINELRAGLRSEASPSEVNPRHLEGLRSVEGAYWKEVGVVTGVAGIILVNALAEEGPSLPVRVVASIPVGALFFLPGALLGAQFRKRPASEAATSP